MNIPNVGSHDARPTVADIDIKNLSTAINSFSTDTGRLPTAQEGLAALIECPVGLKREEWKGPYLQAIRDDPWCNPYQYVYPSKSGKEKSFDLISAGPDGKFNTQDDITN